VSGQLFMFDVKLHVDDMPVLRGFRPPVLLCVSHALFWRYLRIVLQVLVVPLFACR
jgi:hypothetical protein